jgi:SAM-dependent methyltransferase
VDVYNTSYGNYERDVYREVRLETYGEDFGQTSWVTTEESHDIPRRLELTPGSSVLEIGSGSGRYALYVAETARCRVVGLDVNAEGIRNAGALAERQNFWIASQRELYQRMADYEDLLFQVRDGGREVTVANPTDRRIAAMVVEQRQPFASVWDGDEELVHVVRDAFVTVPPLPPGGQITLRFEAVETEAPLLRQPSHKGLVILDARHDPRTGETRVVVSVCRAQRLGVESVDPEGVYRVQVDDEPASDLMPRTVRTIQALLSKQSTGHAIRTRRTKTPGVTTFLEVPIAGDEHRFVERTIRIAPLPALEAAAARASILAAIPARTGRVI